MALSQLDLVTINNGIAACKKIVNEIEPVLHMLNVVYDSAGGSKTTITQANMDLAPQLSGLTKLQLDDGMFMLTSTLKNAISTGYTQLAALAARA